MKNNITLAVLLFIVSASFTLPLFYAIADGQFYWGIAPSLIFAIFFYLQAEKTKQERNETLNSSTQENLLSQKKIQVAIEKQTLVTNSKLDLLKQIVENFAVSNNKLIKTLEDSFAKQDVNLSGIQQVFAANNVLIKKTIIDNNNSYKVNLDKMIHFVDHFETNHKTLVEDITKNQANLEKTIKSSFRSFDDSVESLSGNLGEFVKDPIKENSRVIADLIENNEKTQKAYLKNSEEILNDLKKLHKADEQLIEKLLLENGKD
jgi:hypothetical protein